MSDGGPPALRFTAGNFRTNANNDVCLFALIQQVMQEPVARAALRTAHQVAFLVRRHRADRAEYLRNKDASMTEAERQGLVAHPVVLVCDNVRWVGWWW